MRRSYVITTAIQCPYDTAYQYLSNPANFGNWAAVDAGSYRRLDDDRWVGSTATGPWKYRFTPANSFGVLDHEIALPEGAVVTYPMRLVRNEDGCEVQFTYFAHRDMDDAEFSSIIDWIALDFKVLKSLLEASNAP